MATQISSEVSVIVTNYNYGRYIEQAIESALDQTLQPREIVVIDDGSTDRSSVIYRKYSGHKLIQIHRQTNQGTVAAKNAGASLAHGRWLIFLDADDVLEAKCIELSLQAYTLRGQEKTGFVYSDMHLFGRQQGIMYAHRFSRWRLKYANYVSQSAMIRRRAFESVGGYKPEMAGGNEDWELYLALVENGWRGLYVAKNLVRYRQHTRGRNVLAFKQLEKLCDNMYQLHPKLYHWPDRALMRWRLGPVFARLQKVLNFPKPLIRGDWAEFRRKLRVVGAKFTPR